jgi:hypothetical protein
MKLLFKSKDGGKESSVTGYWLIESKSLFSVVLLKFEGKSREAYHTHAFNAVSWLLNGSLIEYFKGVGADKIYTASLTPIVTTRDTFHKVSSVGNSWALSFRGPWTETWKEYTTTDDEYLLTNGRVRIGTNRK